MGAASTPLLGALVDTLTPILLEVIAAPHGLNVPVRDVVIRDPAEAAGTQTHDIVLAVGVPISDERQVRRVIAESAAHGASALILKVPGEPPAALADAAADSGIAVLGTPGETTWAQLHSLLRTSIATTGEILDTGAQEARAGDLFSLANAVAAMVGGPVTIEDPQSRVLAYSNLGQPIDDARRQTILGRRVPPEWMDRLRKDGLFSRLWSSTDVVQYDAGDNQTRLAVAVRGGGEILGSIWAADGGEPFKQGARAALREAASMAALHLVRHRAGEDLERRMRGDLLRALLEQRGSVDAIAARLGLEVDTSAVVVAFRLETVDEADMELKRERVIEFVVTYCEAFRRRAVQVTVGRTLYVLLPDAGPPDDTGTARRLAGEVVDRAQDVLGAGVVAGIGGTVPDLRGVPQSCADADRVLAVLTVSPTSRRVAHIDDVRPHAALLEIEEIIAERPHLRSHKLGLLAKHDERQGSAHIATLRAYLDCFGDIAAAACQVHVHPNTFRYRLRRLVELSGIDLDDADERLVTQLQLRQL